MFATGGPNTTNLCIRSLEIIYLGNDKSSEKELFQSAWFCNLKIRDSISHFGNMFVNDEVVHSHHYIHNTYNYMQHNSVIQKTT